MSARWLSLLLLPSLSACNQISSPLRHSEPVLAQVGDFALTKAEADQALMGTYTETDSALVYDDYIRKWIRDQTLFHKANQTLSDSAKNKQKLMDQYYRDLLVYELQTLLIQERLDTNVPEDAIRHYYENNIRNFELKENIVRLRFMKFPAAADDLNDYWADFISNDSEKLENLKNMCEEEGGYVMADDTTWLYFNDILKEIPIITYNQESFLNNNKLIQLTDRGWVYFVNILDFKIKNNVSPYEFESPRIRNIIINKRKVELMQQIEDEIVQEAYDQQLIEIR
ncbi:MAG: hypothetical protein H6608_09655 [Flavobacteriales bacterium]|nr:hypothetical protein [Bacteroidota bacterium]MCB9241386.1 hypothetical protein [Flavobacteriales bacterium]